MRVRAVSITESITAVRSSPIRYTMLQSHKDVPRAHRLRASVDLDGAVDGPHEPIARVEADGASDHEKERGEDEHVREVDEGRHEAWR